MRTSLLFVIRVPVHAACVRDISLYTHTTPYGGRSHVMWTKRDGDTILSHAREMLKRARGRAHPNWITR